MKRCVQENEKSSMARFFLLLFNKGEFSDTFILSNGVEELGA